MKRVDMRSLAPAAQEERRRQVIGLRERGLTYAEIAQQVGLGFARFHGHRYGLRGRCEIRLPRGREIPDGRMQTATVVELIVPL